MPSLVTHHHFAVMVQQNAEPDIVNACNASPAAYRWGAQGPDILYFHNMPFSSRIALLGRKMHREKIAECFQALVRSAARQKDPVALSYLLGFCTHYCLDRRVHPFIQYMATHRLQPRYPAYSEDACHHLCEADLDAQVIAQYISAEPLQFEAHRLLDVHPSVSRVIARLFGDVGLPVYGIDAPQSRIEASMRSTRLAHMLLHSGSSDTARAQLASLEKLVGHAGTLTAMLRPHYPSPDDLANLSHNPWFKPHLPTVKRTESFFDLFLAAIPSAVALQRAVYNAYHKHAALNLLFFPSDYHGIPFS